MSYNYPEKFGWPETTTPAPNPRHFFNMQARNKTVNKNYVEF